jgi:shikimate kinase/3-dehydroquinate synthase
MQTESLSKELKKESFNIALTGLMGSGKTTVGKYLADNLKKTFIDTDQIIEEKEGKTISQIFEENGEDYFRHLEARLIEEIFSTGKDLVVSLGGGAIVNSASRKIIKDNARLIALIADPNDLHQRIKRRKSRPLLNESKNQLETLNALWQERKEAYYDSHIQIVTEGKTINSIGIEIIQNLNLSKPKVQEQEVKISAKHKAYKIYFKDLYRFSLAPLKAGKKVLVISQEPIAKHYMDILLEKISSDGYEVSTMVIDNSEEAKNFFTYQLILQKLLSLNFGRKDTLVALGGGVVGDITGFAASTFYRGINYVQVPTTLLSMIDSSVGGKTAINVPEGKNLIGSFYQPHMVHIDAQALNSLPDREFKSGLGELVKYTMLGSAWDELLGDHFFDYVNLNAETILEKDLILLNDLINHCLRIKAGIVAEDEQEHGIRAHLNLGHTFAHALEEVTKYKEFTHGEAVAIGLACACYLSEELGYIKRSATKKVLDLMKSLGLKFTIPKEIKVEKILAAFKYDKKSINGVPNFILPKGHIGRVEIVSNIDSQFIINAIKRNYET